MTEKYPPYIRRLLAQAQALLDEDDYGQADAAALCFEVLALFPENQEAAELVYRAFSDPWLIRDNRKAISRNIDEWDDRPWQQRRRLAFSFRYMSRWEERHRRYDEEAVPPDVSAMLDEGRHQLLQDYLMGQSRGSEVAWSIFQEAIKRTGDPLEAMLWIGHLYADQGYFAESVEVLEDLLSRYPDADAARRLWAEVRWWRDNQHRIPWIPPAGSGDGSRFRRMIARVDPEFAEEDSATPPMDHIPPDKANLPADFDLPPSLPDELQDTIEAALGQAAMPSPAESLVDWSYLDLLESDEIDVTRFPKWAQHLLLALRDPEQEAFMKQYLLSYLANPPTTDDEEDDFFDEPDWEDE